MKKEKGRKSVFVIIRFRLKGKGDSQILSENAKDDRKLVLFPVWSLIDEIEIWKYKKKEKKHSSHIHTMTNSVSMAIFSRKRY